MTEPPFTLEHDVAARFLRIEVSGFWSAETLAAFRDATAAVSVRLLAAGASPGQGSVLIVAHTLSIQDKAVVEDLATFLPMYSMFTRRFAVVGSESALQRMQLKRLMGANGRVFADEAEARAWLSAD